MFRHLVLFSGSQCPVQLSERQPSLLGRCLYDSVPSLGGGNYSSSEAVTKLPDPPPLSVHQEVEFEFLNKPWNGHRPLKKSHCLLGSRQRVSTIRLVLELIAWGVVWALDQENQPQGPIHLSLSLLTTSAKLATQQTS